MRKLFLLFLTFCFGGVLFAQSAACSPDKSLLQMSEQLLFRVKKAEPTDNLVALLANVPKTDLIKGLCNDNAKKVFWVNMYNAYYQLLIQKGIVREKVFTQEAINIAGLQLSLDAIEHGVLRRSAAKYSLGYAKAVAPKPYLKELQVEVLDFRIHFALNCGAKSCPPIAFYKYDDIDTQLERATDSYLNIETTVNEQNKTVEATQIMQWFQGDFGGQKGVKKVLEKYLQKNLKGYKIRYQKFNNDTYLNNFQ
ncbi:MAG: DUF547 domain-containing protein [Bacteroidia bacterium]